MALINKLSAIGDAIREKTGKADQLSLDQMVTEIAGMETGGGDTSIEDSLIDGSLTTYTNERVTTIRGSAFSSYVNMVTASFPNVVAMGASAFYQCTKLTSANLPKLNNASGNSHFYGCSSLESISLPNYGRSGNYNPPNFNGCKVMTFADIGYTNAINAGAFTNCAALKTIVLRKTSGIASLANVSTFNSTPFASGGSGGTVYVPSALIESYKTATNWSTLYTAGTCNFVAIEGSEYE